MIFQDYLKPWKLHNTLQMIGVSSLTAPKLVWKFCYCSMGTSIYLCRLVTQQKWRKSMIQSLVLDKLTFNEHKWVLCVHFKTVSCVYSLWCPRRKFTIFKSTHMTHLFSLNASLLRTNDWIILFLHFGWVSNWQGYTCFLCLWDNSARDQHWIWKKKNWPKWSSLQVGSHNVVNI